MKWTTSDIPDQTGKVIVITGANSGIGFESARAIAGKGATVFMACRSVEKGATARDAILAEFSKAQVEVMALDLGSLASIRAFAEAFLARHNRLHVLMNNAGIMAVPQAKTVDGFESQFGTNHLGHFALTGLLLPMLLATPGSRVVTTSSDLYKQGRMNFDDLHGANGYSATGAYANSKLANVLFALELQRKLASANASTISVATHPGWAATNLQGHTGNAFYRSALLLGNRLLARSPEQGAIYQIYAATAPEVVGGGFYGPKSLMGSELANLAVNERGSNTADAARLWQLSVELTGVDYAALQPVRATP